MYFPGLLARSPNERWGWRTAIEPVAAVIRSIHSIYGTRLHA